MRILALGALMAAAGVVSAQQAEFVVTSNVLRPAEKVPPLGANDWGKCGAVEWAANNFVTNSGNEPIHRRGMYRAKSVGENWFIPDGPGTLQYSLYASGFLSGAEARVYRLVDRDGKAIVAANATDYPDITRADHVALVGKARIIPEGTAGFPDGGYLANRYTVVHPHSNMDATQLSCVDNSGVANGRAYWYTVVAVGQGDAESDPSNEVSATPDAGKEKVTVTAIKAGTAPAASQTKEKPQPPRNLKAVAGNGSVTLSWEASPSPGVQRYRLKRSVVPSAQQQEKIYLEPGAPALLPWDYITVDRRFDSFDMKYVSSRVRGIGNPMDTPNWPWRGDLTKVAFSLVKHPQPLPAEMLEPGETCLRVDVKEGQQQINQIVFCGTKHEGESIWYGLLEPGKHYELEVWLRQEGFKDGSVKFSYANGYPTIGTSFAVTGQWQKFTFSFDGLERPEKPLHFGHTLTMTGPGTLWMDNFRIYRCDRKEDLGKPYLPNRTVLDELLRSQPATGGKGVHRTWYLSRDANMSSILSWHANSKVSPDWSTGVGSTMAMTLPMGLMFDLATGDAPSTRMRPWLVLQHLLHSEQDWLNLVEYLAAPYDPAKDSPQSKPWAYQRYQQRGGVGTPWVDEFSQITIEFGNETWHNGVIEDWIGFSRYGAVWQGGREYGLFAQYLIDNMKKSPYFRGDKIRFNLGAGYPIDIRNDKVTGYGEEAMQTCRDATMLGHANYVGPKWETNQKAFETIDDQGYQATLLGFVAGPEASQVKMGQARDILARTHHPYDLAAYEGGPSGYPIPTMGRGTVDQARIAEFYGKSLAMAVAALDSWLASYRDGWTDQAYLGYATGRMWSSHTTLWQDFRPHAGWLALTLRNRFASGDFVSVEPRNVPTIEWNKKQYPSLGVYVLRNGNRWNVFVLSRRLAGDQPLTLKLPFASASRVTLNKLAGDPRSTNIEKMSVQIASEELPVTSVSNGSMNLSMPAGSIHLYSIDAR